jgi:hypothetical protein
MCPMKHSGKSVYMGFYSIRCFRWIHRHLSSKILPLLPLKYIKIVCPHIRAIYVDKFVSHSSIRGVHRHLIRRNVLQLDTSPHC